jgi:hypothetical protein
VDDDPDGDGYPYGYDCDNHDADVNMGAEEIWYDGVDENCDGADDFDQDGDGAEANAYGGEDCDDLDPTVSPLAADTWYDGVDSNCDGADDYDQDGDGDDATSFGGSDCDDTVSSTYPGAADAWYDGVDADCAGDDDFDQDADGEGASAFGGEDCDDLDPAVNLLASETCDGVDQDCDGLVDEGVTTAYYVDADGDGYGDPASEHDACAPDPGDLTDDRDCDDTDAAVNPAGTEIAHDGVDEDCDGAADDVLAATETSWTILGEVAGDAIGSGGVWTAEDLDGDGDAELVVGAPGWDDGASLNDQYGVAAFHDAETAGLGVGLTDGWYDFIGRASRDAGEHTGQSFAVLGDVDGDGFPEVAIGSSWFDRGASTYAGCGQVYLTDVHGATGTYRTVQYDDTVVGSAIYGSSGIYLGTSLAAGDFDGDGVDELAAGAPAEYVSSNGGYVFVPAQGDWPVDAATGLGSVTFEVTGVSNGDMLGESVAFGDLDADGYDDLVACSPRDDDGGTDAGTCWVIAGDNTRGNTVVSGTVSALATATITGSAADDALGSTPQSLSIGDLDADGVMDVAVGVPGYDGASVDGGAVWVYLGGALAGAESLTTADYVVTGDGALGTSVNVAGDVTGDGVSDLLAGATTAGSGAGTVYLFAGGLSPGSYTLPDDQSASWAGEATGDTFGTAISALRDLDGDGTGEFAVSAPGNDEAASAAGKVYVLPGG